MKNVVNCALAAKKKIFLLAFLAVFSSFYTNVWGTVTYSLNTTTKTLTFSGTGAMDDYTDPNGSGSPRRPATWVFNVQTVVIEDGVTSIGEWVFYGLTNLKYIYIPTSVTQFKAHSFQGCTVLERIYYAGTPNQWANIDFAVTNGYCYSHPFNARTSGYRDFYFYGSTTTRTATIVLSPGITEVKAYAFYKATDIQGINIPSSVTTIRTNAFNVSSYSSAWVAINKSAAPSTVADDAFNKSVNLYVPTTNSYYTGTPWSFSNKYTQDVSGTCTMSSGYASWVLDADGVLTITGHGEIGTYASSSNYEWVRFRRLVHKVVIQGDENGDITSIGNALKWNWAINEVTINQTSIPTSSVIGGNSTTFGNLINTNTSDKITLNIMDPASRSDASWSNLNSDPWNHSRWEYVFPTASSAWSLHYGTDGQSDWTTVDFSRVESTTEWQIEDFVIPDKPNWYVDNATGDDAKKTLSDWGDLYFAASQGDGDRPMVGDATGAIGTVRIYDNSDWNNRYAGFIPNGYVLKIGSNEYSFALEEGNEYRSEIIEYSSANARDNVSVGIVDANGDFVSTNNTSEMQHIFLHVGNNTDLWGKDNAKFVLYDVTNSSFTCAMTLVPGETCLYEGWVPSNCATVIFVRRGDNTLSFDDKWNQTGDLSLLDNQNLFTISSFSDGYWSAYTQKGRFCIWQNSIEKNWGVCFRPCYEFNNTAGDGNWNTAGNWKPQSVPTIDFDVFLNKPVTVNVTTAQAKSVVINQKGDNTGQLVVDAGQKLIVAESIQKTTNGETYSATEANDIIINSDATHGLGALVIGTHDGTNQATVNFTTLSNGTSEDNTSIAQYVGTPFNDETNILHNWYNSWVYGIDHPGGIIGWERVNEGQGMAPFKGYCIFSADGTHHNYWQQGTLVASENQTISGLNWQSDEGTANPNNENLLANSWMAPIKISTMEASDFTNTEATIYIFNSTSASAYTSLASNYSSYTPGTAGEAIIPSMQSFSVFTNAAGGSSVTLDYNKIVYQPAISGTVPGPNRAPLREAAEEANKLRLFVHAESGYGDLLYMWERSDFSEEFENGWDGHKLFGESVAPQLFAFSPDGDLAINCIPTFEGIQMGFKAGEQDNSYTLTFEYSDEAQPLYLLDIQTNIYTQITSATSYSFTTTDTEVHNRFVLTYNAPSTPTALETTPVVTTGKKVIYDNHLFILHNGRIFSAQGAMIQ